MWQSRGGLPVTVQAFQLTDDWVDIEAERGLVAAVAKAPALYWEAIDYLPEGVFVDDEAAAAWRQVADDIEADKTPEAPADWPADSDPLETAKRLADLMQRRMIAGAMERLAAGMYSKHPATELLTALEEEAAQAKAAIRATEAGRLTWAADLVGEVLREAEERRRQREETGKPVLGLPTSIDRLDTLLSGFNTGLYILAGGPGVGKTTFALQIAATVTKEAPVIYLTFENSPANMTLKALAGRAGINTQDVARGFADVEALRRAAEEWRPVGERLAMIEGTGRLTVAQVRALALRAMNRHKANRCLIIVDYLQLWAKASEELQGHRDTRERVEVMGNALRELAIRLDSPVLAIANQNRAHGQYGNKGAASLDSLKESGDLEYMADVAMFLTQAEDRPVTPPARAVTLTVAKNRHGDTGKLELIFRPDIGDFREVARR
jgi:replicative DNA helicase